MGMTDRDKKLLSIFAVIIVLGGYWFLVLGSKRSAVSEAQTAKDAAQADLETAKAAEINGKAEKKKYPVSYARVLKLGKAVPADTDFASLMVQVNDISEDAGVSFVSLSSAPVTASPAGGSTTATGLTVCESTATPEGGASGATGASAAATGPTAQSAVGQTIATAQTGAASANADAARAAGSSATLDTKCASAPTLTDLAAVSSGLVLYKYSFVFNGSFFQLHDLYSGLLNMVNAKGGKVSVTGRLLQIDSIDMAVKDFPQLTGNVEMTGYSMPEGASIAGGATPAAPAAAAAVPAAAAPATAAPPPATILGGK